MCEPSPLCNDAVLKHGGGNTLGYTLTSPYTLRHFLTSMRMSVVVIGQTVLRSPPDKPTMSYGRCATLSGLVKSHSLVLGISPHFHDWYIPHWQVTGRLSYIFSLILNSPNFACIRPSPCRSLTCVLTHRTSAKHIAVSYITALDHRCCP